MKTNILGFFNLDGLYFALQYLTILQNNHIKQPIRVKRREARIFFIPLR